MTFSPFAGLNQAEAFAKGKFFKPGDYELRVKQVLAKQTQRSGLCTIVAFEILASTHPEYPVGGEASWVQPMKNPSIALSAIKEFLCALACLEPGRDVARIKAELDPYAAAAFEAACGDSNPFMGMLVNLNAFERLTQQKTTFTVHAWKAAVGGAGQLTRIQQIATTPAAQPFAVAPPAPVVMATVPTAPLPGYTPPGAPPAPPGWAYTAQGQLVPAR